MIALEARGLRKCYTAVPVVSDVSFSVASGQVLGCLGANGAGKSTIVRMLTGLSEPTKGQVLSFGANIQKDLVAYRRRLGYVPEEPELYSFLSGWEYLELVGTLRALERRRMGKKIDALLDLFSLAPHRHSSIGSYSKGMRQRILLIAALLHDPEILILDEPLSGLDVVSAMVVKDLIKTLGERGKAIFYCSHVLEVVEKVCSHVMILRKGRVIAYAPTVELRRLAGESSLEDAFVHLMADRDAGQTARDIVEVMSAA
ncbi:MAG TPA: ABC transporter ATP-binding protein [Candidatus Acidoferrales bacterium]|jgi:ABC-2 type transport system ATP-binding protein|nr:ABC transporter ATP-binding protein [Candidatus Acidoferrales bacterium]